MKLILSAILVPVLLGLTYWLYIKHPTIQGLADCYDRANAVYNQKHALSRMAYTKDEKICEKNKRLIVDGAMCFAREEELIMGSELEIKALKRISRLWARENNELLEVVDEHNENCQFPEALIEEYELFPEGSF